MSKLNLKKKVVSVLTDEQQASIKGGGTTSYSNCTGFLCCSQKPCVPASEGLGVTCRMQPGCRPNDTFGPPEIEIQ
ncbi:class I lanthipeptide [uncultured Dokdonia sp.]|mgnify:CR=1 FL=1|uniref:class I lanthipeptide n=1 Tax=uncultured Dokdonia sp. TaxID=575653 RepID=UPI0026256FBF|nr:class I lanthipeptide [uncultured Dokdonia sp.]